MAISSTEFKINLRYTYLDQKCQNVQYFRLSGAAFLTATALGVLEAYWNDIKTAMRALTSTSSAVGTFDSILGEEIGGGLSFAEFSIPSGERVGTRAAGDDGEWVSGIMALGMRQTVATRFTRPGQKRFPWLRESDITGNELTTATITLYTPAVEKWALPITLGAPVATGVMTPMIVHEPTVAAPVRATQNVTGYVINTDVTSQVSRKKGRGA